jgi:amidohydrolase
VRLSGPGGHTARPHLTGDLVYALGAVVTQLPALLSRRVDPRAGLSLVWGRVHAGTAPNAIPQSGEAAGTVRCLDADWWEQAPDLVARLVGELVAPFGVTAEVEHVRGVPPVVNDAAATAVLARAARAVVGPASIDRAEQSLGGEDFAWFLAVVPGALARLGVRTPGDETPRDLHQGTFRADDRAVGVGARLLAAAALEALRGAGGR